jgi:homogentisate phytyltransferase/homogentisate geranylgeranyltransferase
MNGARAAVLGGWGRFPPRMAAAVDVLWRFSRPHTIVGTALSVLGLFVVVVAELPAVTAGEGAFDLACTLVAALCVNVYIVGVNQLADVEIDRVNKPFLPLAAGDLSPAAARAIVAIAAVVPVAMAVTQGLLELGFVLAGLAVGTAYSLPPLRLKRFPTLASLSITGVRAVVVNLGVSLHFATALGGEATVPGPVWALTVFVVPFAFAIAILKDVPDMEGDRRHHIPTFTLRLGPRRVVALGMAALTAAYLGMATAGALLLAGVKPAVLVPTHLAALGLLWAWRGRARIEDRASFTRFYLRVWQLFFLEYLIVPLACVLAVA